MANFTLTGGVDNIPGTNAADTIFGTAGTLNPGDKISGKNGTDTLFLSGGGSFDLTVLASFMQVEVVTLNPNDPDAMMKKGRLLDLRGKPGEGLDAANS